MKINMSQEKLKESKEANETKEVQEVRPKIPNIMKVGSEGKFDRYLKGIWLMLGDDYDEREGFYIYYPLSLEAIGKQVVEATKRFGCRVVSTTTKDIEKELPNGKIITYKNVVVQVKQVSAAR